MRMIRSRDKSGHDAYYDAEYLRRLDAEQGRRQLNAAEVEAMIAMSVARQLAEDAWEVLKPHAEYSGAAQRLRTAIPMIRNANVLMADKVRGQQLLTIANNSNDTTITLSAQPMAGCINLDRTTLMHICNRATEVCDLICTATREESKSCQLRRALSNVPGIREAARAGSSDPGRCPYAAIRLEVDEDADV